MKYKTSYIIIGILVLLLMYLSIFCKPNINFSTKINTISTQDYQNILNNNQIIVEENKDIDIDKDKDKDKAIDKEKKKDAGTAKSVVRSFGTHKNIMLTSEQYNELESRCRSVGLSLESYISKLSQWLFTKGRHCTDPYRIISGWLDNDSKRKTAAKPKERQGCDLSWYDDFAMNFDLSKFF